MPKNLPNAVNGAAQDTAEVVGSKLLSPKELLRRLQEGTITPELAQAHLTTRQMLTEALNLEAQAEVEAAAAEQRMAAIQEMIAEKVREQQSCPHQKQNGEYRVGGQRDHRGNTIYFCQWCQMTWNQSTIPPHIMSRIDPARIGGP